MDWVTIDWDNRYSQNRHHDILRVWDIVFSWVILRTCDHENYGHNNSLSAIWHMLLDGYSMAVNKIIGGFKIKGL